MPVYKSSVFILRCQDWSESSQVVQLMAREAGRIRCLAKGSRRGLNPFSGPLDRWVIGDAVFSMTDPNKLATLMELFETERLDGLRGCLQAFYGASYLTELVTAIVPDADAQPAVFDLLVQSMRTLAQVEPAACRAVTYASAWRLLALLGYVPGWDRCVQCGHELAAGKPADYSAGLGGPVCPQCRPEGRVHRLTGRTVQAAAFLTAADWAEVRRVRLSPATANQMRAILTARVAELAGKELSAAKYV
jgi:DNA repair protein RecO (recombination protein O)